MVDPLPGNIRDMQQSINAAKVHEGAVVGYVLDHAVEDLTLRRFLINSSRASCGFLQNGAARNDDVVPRPVHFQNLEGLRVFIKGAMSRTGRMSTWLPGRSDGAREIHDEAALDAAEDNAVDAFLVLNFLQVFPGFLASAALSRISPSRSS